MYFDELDLNDNVLDALYDMHFETCTPVQEKCIPEILKGNDVLGVAQTGTGKTAAYLLPVLSKLDDGGYPEDAVNCIVMAPTRELAQQIDQAMQGFSYYMNGVSSVAIYGGNDGNRYDQELKSLQLGADVVIATPGRFISHISLDHVDLSRVSFFILDEADRMLDMGFYDDIMTIAKKLPQSCQTIMFSATMPEKIEELAKNLLKNPVKVKLAVSKPAEKIKQSAYVCYETQKLDIIKDIFKAGNLKRVIIFSGKKQKVKQINAALTRLNINSGEMHSDLEQAQRDEMMFQFKSGQIDVLVATDILSRGIDIDDIAMVINYDVPRDAEDYVHRIGRTARADRDGVAITFVSDSDITYFKQIEKFLERTIDKTPLPEGMEEGPEYKSSKRSSAKSRRRKDRDRNAHKRKPRNKGNAKEPKAAAPKDAEAPKQDSQQQQGNKPQQGNKQRQEEKPRKEAKPQKEGKEAKPVKEPKSKKEATSQKKEAAPQKKEARQKAEGNRQAETAKPAENGSGQGKKHRRKPQNKKRQAQKTQAQVHPTSSKYAVPEGYTMPKKQESGIKALIKKPLKWLRKL